MKLLTTEHKNIPYEFRLLERTRQVQVIKANVYTYTIRCSVGLFLCDCPGAKFHGKCWHLSIIGQLKRQPALTEPWTEWAEEAGEIMEEGRNYAKAKT